MKKALGPMLVSLGLCGAATTALIAGSAHAQTVRKPMLVAMMTAPGMLFDADTAAPPTDGGGGPRGMRMPSPAEMAARHKQMCQDAYAHQVGDMAYLEAKLSLTAAQQPAFDHWKGVKLDIAKRGAADCATRELPSRAQNKPSPLDGMAREEEMLKHRIADLDAERPALSAFYNSLTDSQKMSLTHPGPEAMMGRHMRFSEALAPPMGQDRRGMGPQPPDGPPPPPQ